ncbi:BnaC04g55420D [Brassica napus]|uniref:BnaC04g55420D protein n=1 Tax=Brassica napus TaxID=3708 RepID=A0A078ISS4_BRANA|nr:BnaC04g55420D [Brassica napus]
MAMAAAVIVPLGLLFFIFGLLVNLLLAICYLVWIVDWWAGVTIKVFTDNETFNRMGKEHALVVCNHRSDIDWLVGWILAQRSGCLGSALAVTKKSSKFLPVKGWSMWFSEYLFLERNWVKDESTIKSGLQRLKDFPQPFWLALFVEGTRFTETKLKAAQEYAASSELPIPRNVLIPRTKGFVSTVINMRSFVPVIYDMTVAIPKSSPPPTMLRLFKGQPSLSIFFTLEIFILDTLISSRLCGTGCTVRQTHSGRYFLPSARTEHWPSHVVSCSGSIMGLHTNSRSNEILALVKSLFLMERHGVISAWSRKITVADIIKCAKVSVIPFAVHMGEVCSVHKLKINLYKPEDYPKHTDITEAHLEETMTVMFLRKLEDAEHAIFIFAAYASHITDKFEEDYGSRYYKDYGSVRSSSMSRGQGYGGGVDLDADAQKRKKQATDEQGYEESCDDEKNEPSFTGGVDDLVMDNEDENTEVAYCGDPQVIWEELHNQLLNSAE